MVTRGKAILLSYLAGIVDADGHVGIHTMRRNSLSQRRLTPRYQCEIVVTNCDRDLIDLLMQTFGGRDYVRKKLKEHHKTTYTWKATDRTAYRVAEELLPYLRIKRGQAALVIEFDRDRIKRREAMRGALHSTEVERREDILRRMRVLTDDRRPQRLSERATSRRS